MDLAELDKAATQGKWGQYHPIYGPWAKEAFEYFKDKSKLSQWDTTHHMSAVFDGVPKRLATFTHADDAAFAEALVNAYRSGELVLSRIDSPQE